MSKHHLALLWSILALGACDNVVTAGDAGAPDGASVKRGDAGGRKNEDAAASGPQDGDGTQRDPEQDVTQSDGGGADAENDSEASSSPYDVAAPYDLDMSGHALVPHRDGVLVLGASNGRATVARFEADGTLDATFSNADASNSGRVITRPPGASTGPTLVGSYAATALEAEDGVLVGGAFGTGQDHDGFLAKLTDEGEYDTSFADQGRYIVPADYSQISVRRILHADNGDILVFVVIDTAVLNLEIHRLSPNGELLGVHELQGGITETWRDGAGVVFAQGLTVRRVDADLEPDPSFGLSGDGYTRLRRWVESANAAVRYPNGDVVVATTDFVTENEEEVHRIVLARFDASGALVESFGDNGQLALPYDDHGQFVYGAKLRDDGKLLVYAEAVTSGDAWFAVIDEDGGVAGAYAESSFQPYEAADHDWTAPLASGVTADRMLLQDDGTMWLAGRIERQDDTEDVYRLWVYRGPQPE